MDEMKAQFENSILEKAGLYNIKIKHILYFSDSNFETLFSGISFIHEDEKISFDLSFQFTFFNSSDTFYSGGKVYLEGLKGDNEYIPMKDKTNMVNQFKVSEHDVFKFTNYFCNLVIEHFFFYFEKFKIKSIYSSIEVESAVSEIFIPDNLYFKRKIRKGDRLWG